MVLNWKPLTFCFLAVLCSSPLQAQRTGGGNGGRAGANPNLGSANSVGSPTVFGGQPTQPAIMQPIIPNTPLPKPQVVEDEACLPWALSQIRGATVSVMRLEVPDKARSEFDKACGDFHKKKLADAEQHVRSAIDKYSNYVAAWVMLGEVLEAQQESDKAHDACEHANTADPTYLPPYICLAELDARSGKWNEILNVTKTALGLNPVGDLYAYFYRAMAFYNLNKLPEAEKSAIEAEGIDTEHREAPVHYLLAQIYDAKGDEAAAISELRQFLKFNQDKEKAEEAKQYLAKLQAQDSSGN
jgi:tetratricopeptide (TPR) repeat protein